ncbi:MAG: isoprenylcysteine carboxylmethyltransferase family protein [Ktedonobacteraceae bacterium]
MTTNTQDNPGVVAPPPLIYAGGLAIGLLFQRLLPMKLLPRTSRSITLTLGSTCISLALTILFLGIRQMRNAHTNVNPTHPATTIVTEGPFRFTRNPLYLGLLLLYLGITFVVNSLWTMLFLPAVLVLMNVGVIAREERYLERKFGASYLTYKQSVRRWL